MEGTVKRSPREQILAEAVRLFCERGYSSTSMRDIASAVGLLPGSLYVHIEGKEQLLGEIVEAGIEGFLEACGPALRADGPADERMREAIRAHMQVLSEDLDRVLVSMHQWKYLGGDRREAVIRKRREYHDIFSGIVDDGLASGVFRPEINSHLAVLTIIGTLNSVAEWFSPEGPDGPEQIADEIADVLVRGLGAGPA